VSREALDFSRAEQHTATDADGPEFFRALQPEQGGFADLQNRQRLRSGKQARTRGVAFEGAHVRPLRQLGAEQLEPANRRQQSAFSGQF